MPLSPAFRSFLATVLLGPLAALGGGIVVVLRTQNIEFGVTAGIAGLAVGLVVGLVVGYAIAEFWARRWPDAYDNVDSQAYRRAWREHGGGLDQWPAPISTLFLLVLFFGGTVTALVVTLLAGRLPDGCIHPLEPAPAACRRGAGLSEENRAMPSTSRRQKEVEEEVDRIVDSLEHDLPLEKRAALNSDDYDGLWYLVVGMGFLCALGAGLGFVFLLMRGTVDWHALGSAFVGFVVGIVVVCLVLGVLTLFDRLDEGSPVSDLVTYAVLFGPGVVSFVATILLASAAGA